MASRIRYCVMVGTKNRVMSSCHKKKSAAEKAAKAARKVTGAIVVKRKLPGAR